jgi:hypothetical protein
LIFASSSGSPFSAGRAKNGFSSPSGIWRFTTSEKSSADKCAHRLLSASFGGNVSARIAT